MWIQRVHGSQKMRIPPRRENTNIKDGVDVIEPERRVVRVKKKRGRGFVSLWEGFQKRVRGDLKRGGGECVAVGLGGGRCLVLFGNVEGKNEGGGVGTDEQERGPRGAISFSW